MPPGSWLETAGNIALCAFGICAIQRVHIEKTAIFRHIDRKRAGRQRDEVGQKRDFKITLHGERKGKNAGASDHVRARDENRNFPGGNGQFLEEQHDEGGNKRMRRR